MRGIIPILLITVGVGSPAGVAAEDSLDVPLTISHDVLDRELAREMGMDSAGHVRLRQDACNQATLSDMHLASGDGVLQASFAVRARMGTEAMGRCLGPGEWHGRARVTLAPEVSESGLAVRFRPGQAELRRPDDTETLRRRPAGQRRRL